MRCLGWAQDCGLQVFFFHTSVVLILLSCSSAQLSSQSQVSLSLSSSTHSHLLYSKMGIPVVIGQFLQQLGLRASLFTFGRKVTSRSPPSKTGNFLKVSASVSFHVICLDWAHVKFGASHCQWCRRYLQTNQILPWSWGIGSPPLAQVEKIGHLSKIRLHSEKRRARGCQVVKRQCKSQVRNCYFNMMLNSFYEYLILNFTYCYSFFHYGYFSQKFLGIFYQKPKGTQHFLFSICWIWV